MSDSSIEVSQSGAVARITLARPERHNAIDLQMCLELARATAAIEKDASVRVVVLTGQGSAFSVGGDLVEFLSQRERLRQHILEMTSAFHAAIESLHRMPAALLVAVNGMAAGGGFSLVCGADLAVAKRSARLVSAYTRSGLTPDGGGTWLLPRLVGRQRAFDLMATNPTLTAEQALELGLLSRVVDDERFEAEVEEVAQRLAALPSAAAGSLKRLLEGSATRTLAGQLEAEALSISSAVELPETLRRLDAFVRKT